MRVTSFDRIAQPIGWGLWVCVAALCWTFLDWRERHGATCAIRWSSVPTRSDSLSVARECGDIGKAKK